MEEASWEDTSTEESSLEDSSKKESSMEEFSMEDSSMEDSSKEDSAGLVVRTELAHKYELFSKFPKCSQDSARVHEVSSVRATRFVDKICVCVVMRV